MSDQNDTDGTSGDGGASPVAVAVYIGAISSELAQLALANGFEYLGYLLDMARLEANEIAKSPEDPSNSADQSAVE